MEQRAARRDTFRLVVVIATLTAGLHLLGCTKEMQVDWSDPIRWLEQTGAEIAVAAVLRNVGLAVGYWITVSTLLYALSHGRQLRRGFISRITLPSIRRIVDTALATALVASIVNSPLQPALAEEPPGPEIVFDINTDGVPIPVIRISPLPQIEEPEGEPASERPDDTRPATLEVRFPDTPPPALPPAALAGSVPSSPPTTITATAATPYTVSSGDNLWVIAERQVHAATGYRPIADETANYWRRLIAANRTTLRSGDPNLIYPGEIILLPPIEVAP